MIEEKTKIIATLGPATSSFESVLELAKNGADIFRINLSHATHDEVDHRIAWIRKAEKILNKPLGILGDLPGAKIRISDMEKDVVLEKGQKYIISKNKKIGDSQGCGLSPELLIDVLKPGAKVFIDDGMIQLIVENVTQNSLETVVLVGGHLRSRKGFFAEGITLSAVGLTTKDKTGIKLMVPYKPDMIAVSFVETEKDINNVKKLLPENTKIKIIAKIETIKGVLNIEKILKVSDGLMIARGDLGLALPLVQIPRIQKDLIALCNKYGKFVITATHMLESMIHKPIPTRAEVSDIANAVLDGTDAVMLSAETAAGKHPMEAVEMMREIIEETEVSISSELI